MTDLLAVSKEELKQCLSIAPQILLVPFYENPIPAGFPSPADDYMEGSIDLNKHLIKHPSSTFLFKMKNYAMQSIGIFPDSILVIDRCIEPKNGKIVVADYSGQLVVRKFYRNANNIRLLSANQHYPTITSDDFNTITVWGVVTSVITHL